MNWITEEFQTETECTRDNGLFEELCAKIRSDSRWITLLSGENVSYADRGIHITHAQSKTTQIRKLTDGTLAMMSNLF